MEVHHFIVLCTRPGSSPWLIFKDPSHLGAQPKAYLFRGGHINASQNIVISSDLSSLRASTLSVTTEKLITATQM